MPLKHQINVNDTYTLLFFTEGSSNPASNAEQFRNSGRRL